MLLKKVTSLLEDINLSESDVSFKRGSSLSEAIESDDFSSYQFCVLSTNGMYSSHFKNRQSSILYLRDEIKTE